MTTRLLAAATLAVVLAGCASDARPKTAPVSGQVLVNGKPTAGVSLSFHLASGSLETATPGTAKSRSDGRFDVSSFLPNDGLPPGDYVVTIIWPMRYEKIGEQEHPIGDRLGGAYASKVRTPLRVTIHEGENRLDPFNLKSRSP